jgi:hypothetical protein
LIKGLKTFGESGLNAAYTERKQSQKRMILERMSADELLLIEKH